MKPKPESKETPLDETVHSASFLRKALKDKESGLKGNKKRISGEGKGRPHKMSAKKKVSGRKRSTLKK